MKIEVLIDGINEYAAKGQLFWVAGMARECWQVLKDRLDELHQTARIAVEHYIVEEA